MQIVFEMDLKIIEMIRQLFIHCNCNNDETNLIELNEFYLNFAV